MPLTATSPLQTRFLDIFLVALFSQFDEKHIFDVFKRLVVIEDEDAERITKEISVYLSRFFGMQITHFVTVLYEFLIRDTDMRDAIATFKEVTKPKPPQFPVTEANMTKRIKVANKVLDMPSE